MTEDFEKTTRKPLDGSKLNDKQGHLKNYSVILASTIVILGGIHCARSILGPIFIACFFAALLISPVRWLRSKGVSEWASLTVVIIGVLAIGLGTMTVVGSQLTQFAKNIPAYRDAFNEKLNNYNLNLEDFFPFLQEDEDVKEKPAETEKDELAFERFREFERERSGRRDASDVRANETDEGDAVDKDAAKRSVEKTSRTKSDGVQARSVRAAFEATAKTKAFSGKIVPVALCLTGDERSVANGDSFDGDSRIALETGFRAVSKPQSSKDFGRGDVASESVATSSEQVDHSALGKKDAGFGPETKADGDVESSPASLDGENSLSAKKIDSARLLPQANDAESRLTPGGGEKTENRLIPASPEPLMSAADLPSNEDSTLDLATAPENVETAAEISASDLADSADNSAESDPPFEWRANETAVSAVDASSQELFRFLGGLVGELSYLASNAFIITLLVIFMLCEAAGMPQKLLAALGKRRFMNTHIQNVADDIRNYMVIKTLMSLGVGVCVTILLVVSDVQYPLLWGFVAFLLNYIPNIGSVAAAIPPIVLATVEHGLVVGCVDAAFFVFINCFIGYVIEPRLLGNGLDLSPLIVLISLILFGWILGPIGMFLSPPLAVIMKIVFQSFPETRWIAALMANRPPKEPLVDDDALEAE